MQKVAACRPPPGREARGGGHDRGDGVRAQALDGRLDAPQVGHELVALAAQLNDDGHLRGRGAAREGERSMRGGHGRALRPCACGAGRMGRACAHTAACAPACAWAARARTRLAAVMALRHVFWSMRLQTTWRAPGPRAAAAASIVIVSAMPVASGSTCQRGGGRHGGHGPACQQVACMQGGTRVAGRHAAREARKRGAQGLRTTGGPISSSPAMRSASPASAAPSFARSELPAAFGCSAAMSPDRPTPCARRKWRRATVGHACGEHGQGGAAALAAACMGMQRVRRMQRARAGGGGGAPRAPRARRRPLSQGSCWSP